METPFAEYKATEFNIDTLNNYFVEPKHISKMYTNNVSFIIGQRGTGKTTLLKHLCSKYNAPNGKNKTRLGIYYRFDVNKMRSFSGDVLSMEAWGELFAHCFAIEMCLNLTKLLIDLKIFHPLINENMICKKVRNLFFDEPDKNQSVLTLEELYEYLEYCDYNAKKYKRNPLRAQKPMISDCEKTFEEFCLLISQDPNYKNVCVHFLFDEYENMLDYQKEFINSCIKNASCHHTYKICVRPYGMMNMKTLKSSEILKEADDFKTLNYISDIIGDRDDVSEFMHKACEIRLRRYYDEKGTNYTKEDLKIEKYFSTSKSDDELFEIISKNTSYVESVKIELEEFFNFFNRRYNENWTLFQMKLFLVLKEKKGFDFDATITAFTKRNRTYRNWVNNYKKSVLFLCFSETEQQYELSGFQDVITIAGNVVRYVLEICDYCFLSANLTETGKFSPISEKMQTEAIYKVSQRRFQQISTIPNYGQEIKQMVLVVGEIFRMYHKDKQIQRFEPNHFSIEWRNSSVEKFITSEIERAIQLGVTYGVFEAERSTKNFSHAKIPIEDIDYHFHPILTPYFQISWRKKQKCRFSLDDVNTFLFGSDEQISRILEVYLSKIKKANTEELQMTFSQMKKESF